MANRARTVVIGQSLVRSLTASLHDDGQAERERERETEPSDSIVK